MSGKLSRSCGTKHCFLITLVVLDLDWNQVLDGDGSAGFGKGHFELAGIEDYTCASRHHRQSENAIRRRFRVSGKSRAPIQAVGSFRERI